MTANRVLGKRKNVSDVMDHAIEVEVHDANWAIRRTEPHSIVTCFAYLAEKGARCGLLINPLGRSCIVEVHAPCFLGRRKYASGINEQFVWFCNNTVKHTWNVHKSIEGAPAGNAPGVWKVAKGTMLSIDEAARLSRAGFVLDGVGHNVVPSVNTRLEIIQALKGQRHIT